MDAPNATAEGENTRIKFHPSLAPSCDCDINPVLPWPQRQLNLIHTGALSHRCPKKKRRVGGVTYPSEKIYPKWARSLRRYREAGARRREVRSPDLLTGRVEDLQLHPVFRNVRAGFPSNVRIMANI